MNKQDKVLVFGLDGATFKILDPLIDKGKTPNIAVLAKNGVKATLESTIPPLTAPAWVSFQTGVNPGKHGVFDFVDQKGKLVNSTKIVQPKIWQIIAKTGLRSCVINMPVTYPVKAINGVLISSFLTPPNERFAYPSFVEKKLKAMNYQIDLESPFGLEEKNLDKKKVLTSIENLVHSRGKAALWLARKQPWDFFFCLFRATDLIQHLDYDGIKTAKIYRLIDKYLGQIISTFRKSAKKDKIHILLISDHGFHKNASWDIALYPLLRSLSIIPSMPKAMLKLGRLWRKIIKSKPKLGRVTSYGMFEKNSLKRKYIVKKLSQAKIKGKKIFQLITTAEKLYGPNYHANIPDILWLTEQHFAPNPDPLADRILYKKRSPLKGHHYSDRNGIFICYSPNIPTNTNLKKITLPEVTTLICQLLKVPYPDYFVEPPLAV